MRTDRHTQKVQVTIFVLLGIFFLPAIGWTLPVFPGAVGFGTNTPAGRGGTIYQVTNLNDSGVGSLRDCVGASGPRVCIFETSGTITLASNLKIKNPFLTIAGQTAPSPGITLRGHTLVITGHDILVQHIRVRVGDANNPGDADGIGIVRGAYNVVVDHVSVTWAIDENASAYGATTHDITYSNMIVAEALYASVHSKGPHSMGGVAKYSDRVDYLRSLFAHDNARVAKFGNNEHTGAQFQFINNVVYNWGNFGTDVDPDGTGTKYVNIVGNIYKSGTNSKVENSIYLESHPGTQVYLADNSRNGVLPADQWTIATMSGPSIRVNAPPFAIGFTPLPNAQVFANVIANAGARPTDRDAVDAQIVADATNGTGHIINSQNEVGGFPVLSARTSPVDTDHDGMPDSWETGHGLNPNNAADGNLDRNGDGYTNLEEYLNSLFPLSGGSLPPSTGVRPAPTGVQIN